MSESTPRRRRKLDAEVNEAAHELSDAIKATGILATEWRIRDLHEVCATLLDDPHNDHAERDCRRQVMSWGHGYVKGVREVLLYAATVRLASYAQATIYRRQPEWTPSLANAVIDDFREGMKFVAAASAGVTA